MSNRALTGWLFAARAADCVPPDVRLVTAEVRETDRIPHVTMTGPDGQVLALYRVSGNHGRPRLVQAPSAAGEAPGLLARAQALRRSASGQVSHSVALRTRGTGLAARSRAVRSRSAMLLSQSADLRAGLVNQVTRSRALKADAQALQAWSRAARAKAAAQIQRRLALSAQTSTLLARGRAA